MFLLLFRQYWRAHRQAIENSYANVGYKYSYKHMATSIIINRVTNGTILSYEASPLLGKYLETLKSRIFRFINFARFVRS